MASSESLEKKGVFRARSEGEGHRLSLLPVFLALTLTLAVTFLAAQFVSRSFEKVELVKFEREVDSVLDRIEQRLLIYKNALYSVRGLFESSVLVERDEWRDYSRAIDLANRYPGINSLSYVERVPAQNKAAFIESVRKDTTLSPSGYPHFNIHPDREKEEYFVVKYREPFEGNEQTLGFDISFEEERRRALERARDTDSPTATGRIQLITAQKDEPGFGIYLPIYRNDTPHSSLEERREALVGFVVAAFNMSDLMAGVSVKGAEFQDLGVEIFIGNHLGKDTLLFDGDGILGKTAGGPQARFAVQKTLEVADKKWILYFTANQITGPNAVTTFLPVLVLLGGVLFSFLVTWIVHLLLLSMQREKWLAQEVELRRQAEAEVKKANEGLETRVADRTKDLEAANEALESFNYSISHDLRSPLLAISGFSNAILEDYGEKMDEQGRHYLQLVAENSHQMDQLVRDLLEFSRVRRQAVQMMDSIPMGETADAIFRQLLAQNPGRKIKISIQPLAPVRGDMALMRQVFVNLLSNAVKFTRNKEEARIEVGCRPFEKETVYYVKDNGAGFDMKYADKLFQVFHRLHKREEFEGTGCGLAIVQSIVSRHGGRVWAEAKEGEGATFYFALPK